MNTSTSPRCFSFGIRKATPSNYGIRRCETQKVQKVGSTGCYLKLRRPLASRQSARPLPLRPETQESPIEKQNIRRKVPPHPYSAKSNVRIQNRTYFGTKL